MPSTAVARTQPLVEQPISTTVSTSIVFSVVPSEVPKKQLGYCLVRIMSCGWGGIRGSIAPSGPPFTNSFSAGTFLKNSPPSAPDS